MATNRKILASDKAIENSKTIWSNIYPGNMSEIKQLMEEYYPLSDLFTHPILHESSHQSGHDSLKPGITDEMKIRFNKQNELFRYLWTHPKFKNLIHNDIYRDKYEYTALERLRTEYPYYCDEQKKFVRDHICKDIELVELVKNESWYTNGMPSFKNTAYFGKLCNMNDL